MNKRQRAAKIDSIIEAIRKEGMDKYGPATGLVSPIVEMHLQTLRVILDLDLRVQELEAMVANSGDKE